MMTRLRRIKGRTALLCIFLKRSETAKRRNQIRRLSSLSSGFSEIIPLRMRETTSKVETKRSQFFKLLTAAR